MAKCTKCGSDDLRTRRENGGAYGMNQIPLGRGRNAAVALDSTVCISCGNVAFAISDPDALAKIAETWERP
jgi:hypothetical protein